jgi:hypothetical protein
MRCVSAFMSVNLFEIHSFEIWARSEKLIQPVPESQKPHPTALKPTVSEADGSGIDQFWIAA